MSHDDTWAAAAHRLTELAERESDAPDWLRAVLRRMAADPASYCQAKAEPQREISNFIYFH